MSDSAYKLQVCSQCKELTKRVVAFSGVNGTVLVGRCMNCDTLSCPNCFGRTMNPTAMFCTHCKKPIDLRRPRKK